MKLFGRIIPIWALVTLICAGTVVASYLVMSYTAQTKITEPIEVAEIQALPAKLGPGVDIGAADLCGKYFIHNNGDVPLTITVRLVGKPADKMEWYGLRIVYATDGYSSHDTYNCDVPIRWADVGHSVTEATFTIGTVEYEWYAGMPGSEIESDSSCVKIFIDGKVAEDARPGDYTTTLQVFREGPEVQNVGYAQAVVTDQYKIPVSAIQDAIVQATLQTPMPSQAIIEVTSENSNADGSALLKLDGVTSGAIWVVAHKSGYYTSVEETSIPGAQVYPSEALWATPELAKIGTLSLDVSDNSAEWDSSTNTITENLTATNAHYFTIELTVTAAYEALRDMQVAFIRGSDWDNLGASPLVVTVVDDAGTTIGMVGDITLSADISADLNAVGDLDYSVVLKVKVKTNTAYDFGSKELLRITINDLGAGVGYAGDVGISATEIKVVTVI